MFPFAILGKFHLIYWIAWVMFSLELTITPLWDYVAWLTNIYIYIDIYIYIVLFGSVKPELGVIPSEQENHLGAEHLNFPGGELNVIF